MRGVPRRRPPEGAIPTLECEVIAVVPGVLGLRIGNVFCLNVVGGGAGLGPGVAGNRDESEEKGGIE